MKTNAVVFEGVDRVVFREIDMPPPGPGEAQLRTTLSGISCGTEGWLLRNLFTWMPTPYPCVPGYQRVGTITAVGADVAGWKTGDRAMATTGCWKGSVVPAWGAHVAVANTSACELYRIPAGVSDTDAAAAVVAEVGFNAAYRPSLAAGDWVVVYGDGIIGQFGAQAARARGARVILVGHRSERLALATAHSADHAIMGGADVVQRIRALVGADHVPVLIDTVQSEACQREYMPLLQHAKGQIVYSGFTPGETWASMGELQKRELTAHFISGWTRTRMESTLALMGAGKMRMEPLTTHRIDCTQAADAWRMICGKTEEFMGVVLDWRTETR